MSIYTHHKSDMLPVRNHWITLAFVIIKEARRDRDREKFDLWIARIAKIINRDLDWHSRWFHEQCLFELVSLNKIKLSGLLNDWQSINFPSMWRVKLSGILFEIGECLKAEEIARQALTDIRSRLRPYTTDYSLLSQEGIAMMVLEIIERSNNWEKVLDRSNEDRWNILGAYKCNPFTELANLQKSCEREIPQSKLYEEVKEDFDITYIQTTYQTRGKTRLSDLRPGFELIIMAEEIGMLHVVTASSIPRSVQWIEQYYPLWAIEILMRCQNETGIKEYFDSVSIEVLEASNIEILYNWLISRLHNSIKRMRANIHSGNYSDNSWTSFNLSLEVLSRILSRISDEQSFHLFNIVSDYLSDCQDKSLVKISDTIQSFWRRIFERNSNINTLVSIEHLLKITLPNEKLFSPQSIEPFVYIQWKNNFLLLEGFDRTSWNIEISKLITNVHHGDDIDRKYSLLRLLRLMEISALSLLEQENLKSALWSKLDDITGFPLIEFDCIRMSSLLLFPELEINKGDFANLLKQFIMSHEIEEVFDLFINSSSCQLLQSTCIVHRKVIWNSDELHIIMEKIHQYIINTLGNPVNKTFQLPARNFLSNNGLEESIASITRIITLFIAPRWTDINDSTKVIVLDVLNTIQLSKYSADRILPCLLISERYNEDQLSTDLIGKICCSNSDHIEDAIWGIYIWVIYYSSAIEVPRPPNELIDTTIFLFVARREPGFNHYIELVLTLIATIPDLLDIKQLSQLVSGVKYILDETTLNNRVKVDECIIPAKKFRLYRGLAYRITYQLDLIYSIRFPDLYPSIIAQWKEDSLNEIWPEIRSLWE